MEKTNRIQDGFGLVEVGMTSAVLLTCFKYTQVYSFKPEGTPLKHGQG